MGFNEGIGFVPFAGTGWEAVSTIMKDKKSGLAAKAVLISALATDPDPRTNQLLVKVSQDQHWVLRVAALQAITKRGDIALLSKVEIRLADAKYQVEFTAAATIIHLNDLADAQAATADQANRPLSSGDDSTESDDDADVSPGLMGR